MIGLFSAGVSRKCQYNSNGKPEHFKKENSKMFKLDGYMLSIIISDAPVSAA